jgi:Ca2+-transporting ATPase
LGFIAFFDPPKQNIRSVVQAFNNAGIKVKIITGDNESTTRAIADKIEFPGRDAIVNGEQWSTSESADISKLVHDNNIFTRMFPEAKLDIINALKAQHEIVAMTGDGVNDGPALKAAHIGIAMGHRGTEIAKNAASLILVEDDLSKMVDAIAMGRKIYTNLKKAIRYIISIHIPIILIVFIPLVLGWIYPNIFTPVHVILLELIMGPTCSIIYENEPMEKNTMDQPPRSFSANFFSKSELMHSIIQGLAIAVCSLLLYQLCVKQQCTEDIVRTMVFTSLMSANIFLTLVNRSFYYSFWSTLEYKNKLITLVISLSSILILVMIYLDPVTKFFRFDHLSLLQLLLSVAVGFLSVIWFEIVKWNRRQNMNIDATF